MFTIIFGYGPRSGTLELYIRIRKKLRIIADPEKVTDHCGSGSGFATLLETIGKYTVLV
jgi:hypothetical protein